MFGAIFSDRLYRVWYDRLALVLMQHLARPEEAMRVVVDALNDELTHIGELCDLRCMNTEAYLVPVIQPRLERRLARLEKRLKIAGELRHKSDAHLRTCEARTIEGCRVHHTRHQSMAPITSFFSSRVTTRSLSPATPHNYSDPTKNTLKGPAGTHSIWRSKNGEEIGVEELVLEHYSTLGYKGYDFRIGSAVALRCK